MSENTCEDGAWTLLSQRLLHDGYRKVHERRYLMPSGREQIFEITSTPDVACALALDRQGRVLLTRQFRPGPGRLLYVPPGGIIDPGETPEDAMHRELREETGYDGTLIPLHRGIQSAYTTGCRYHFLAVECDKVSRGPIDSDEVAGVEAVPLVRVGELLREGQLADVETVLAGLVRLRDLDLVPPPPVRPPAGTSATVLAQNVDTAVAHPGDQKGPADACNQRWRVGSELGG